MYKNFILFLTLLVNGSLITAQENNQPILIKNFGSSKIIFNDSEETIENLINSQDPEFNEVPLLEIKDNGSITKLGKVGKPLCKTPTNIAEYIELLKGRKKGGWCGNPTKVFFVTSNDNISPETCQKCADFLHLAKKQEALEGDIFNTSL